MAATLTYSDQGVRLSGKLVAGDSATFRIASEDFPEGARLRWTLTDARPPDARHTVAASDEIDPASATEAKMSLKTAEIRQAFRGLRITEAIPAVLELVDTVNDAVYCSLRVQVCNSRALWLGGGDAMAGLSGLTAADVRRYLLTHEARRDNPHEVTADQIGAEPSGTASALVAEHNAATDAHEDIRKAVADASTKANASATDISTHVSATNNPHGVTAGQIGAGILRGGNRWIGDQLFDHSIDVNEGVSCGYLETPGNVTVGGDVNVSGGIYLRDENGVDFYKLTIENGVLHISDEPIRWMNET